MAAAPVPPLPLGSRFTLSVPPNWLTGSRPHRKPRFPRRGFCHVAGVAPGLNCGRYEPRPLPNLPAPGEGGGVPLLDLLTRGGTHPGGGGGY